MLRQCIDSFQFLTIHTSELLIIYLILRSFLTGIPFDEIFILLYAVTCYVFCNWLQKYHSGLTIHFMPLKLNCVNLLISLSRCLQQTPGFSFAPRPSECLPVGFPAHIPGTCHFLLGYRHPDLPAECSSLSEHVEAGVKDLGIFSTQQS